MGIYKPVVNINGTALKLINDTGNAPAYSARAWVNFNGTGTVAIRGSGNVSSITDAGVGNYAINLNTALIDSNCVAIGSSATPGTSYGIMSLTSSATTIGVFTSRVGAAGTAADNTDNYAAIFR